MVDIDFISLSYIPKTTNMVPADTPGIIFDTPKTTPFKIFLKSPNTIPHF